MTRPAISSRKAGEPDSRVQPAAEGGDQHVAGRDHGQRRDAESKARSKAATDRQQWAQADQGGESRCLPPETLCNNPAA